LVRFVPTVCPYCGAGCGILLVVEGQKVIGTEPWAFHPINEGKLCIKGWNAYQFIHHQDRLLHPMIRDNDGNLHKVSWDEALTYVSENIKRIISRYGQDSICFLSSAKCTNEENYLLQKFARAVVGTNNIDHCARL